MADPGVCCYITKILCAHGGRLTLEKLLEKAGLSEAQLRQELEAAGPDRFVILETGSKDGVSRSVVATTKVRICRRKFCQRPCNNLHLCKLNLLGRCHYSQSERNLCKYSHDVLSEDNFKILKNHELSGLNHEELAVLLVQNDPFFLPEICKTYKGEGQKQICNQTGCERLHICEYFTRGECSYLNCLRSHNLMDRKVLAVMKTHGLSPDTVQNIQDICNSQHARRNASGSKAPPSHHHHRRPRVKTNRNRSKSKDRHFHYGSQEFVSSALASQRSCTSSPDPISYESPLEDEPVDKLTHKLAELESNAHAEPSSGLANPADLTGQGKVEDGQRFPADARVGSLLNGNHSNTNSNSTSIPEGSRKPATTNSMFWPDLKNTNGKSRVADSLHVPLGNDANAGAPETASSRSANFKTVMEAQREIPSSRIQKAPGTSPWDSPSTGKMRHAEDPGVVFPYEKDRESIFQAKQSLSNPSNVSGKIIDQRADVAKTVAPDLGIKMAVTVEKQTSSGSQSPTTHDMATSRENAASARARILNLPSPPSSGPRAAASETNGQNSAQVSVNQANEFTRRTPDSTRASVSDVSSPESSKMNDHSSKEICLDYLYNGCRHNSSCNRMHFNLPYRWQLFIANNWVDCKDMERIEEAYCDPKVQIISLGNHTINFQKMICDRTLMRRISTPSTVTDSFFSIFATKWTWYWRSESSKWIPYGEKDNNQPASSVDSLYLESVFQSCPRGVVPFQAGVRSYELSFQGMIQTNIVSKTQREVVRRPAFVSVWEVEQMRRIPGYKPRPTQAEPLPAAAAPQPNLGLLPPDGYELMELKPSCPEYLGISGHFKVSMKNFTIEKIQKIENPRLLQAFERKKSTMTNNDEKLLFYATSRTYMESICRNNFDWTLHGPHETKYGRGFL
ncbi:zinc finger CCCH-type antiviral protein 1 isoform X2 [Ochotona curzoniae]|uniref:zinc finger CCCH-type antiviral protein 1 isoform X2 n=1 Tax=Ochotona curzoniae TaxID=130825 RepID=UPI001B348356|nr:zinc finger CCCH-type antiviral protein 1 isoform X2 [Ochotona curzoniae]